MIGALSDPETRTDDQQVAYAELIRAPPGEEGQLQNTLNSLWVLVGTTSAYSIFTIKTEWTISIHSNTYPGVDYSSGFILELHVGPSP